MATTNSTNTEYKLQLINDRKRVLELLYKFRFVTGDGIAHCFNKPNSRFVYKRLKLLQNGGYIGRRYESYYKLLGRPAAFYLLPEGARLLFKNHSDRESKACINRIYKDKTVSDRFIDECLAIFFVYTTLRWFDEQLMFLTKVNLNDQKYSYLPDILPDGYIKLATGSQFFLQISQLPPLLRHNAGYTPPERLSSEWKMGRNGDTVSYYIIYSRDSTNTKTCTYVYCTKCECKRIQDIYSYTWGH